jgi:ribonuclease J
MINHFCRRGARVFDASTTPGVHASGHAFREEMKTMISLTRPRFLVPVHGEIRQLKTHRELAVGMGFDEGSIVLMGNGDVLELRPGGAEVVGKAATGRVLVDGKTVGETAEVVLRDRQHLSEDGMLIAILNVDRKTGQLLSEPEIVTRGFVYVDESEDLINELRALVRETFESLPAEAREESEVLNTEVRRALRRFIRRNYDRYPLILPVVQQI